MLFSCANGYNEYHEIPIWNIARKGVSIALTEEGTLLRDRAEDLISMADKIEKEFLSLDDLTGGDLYFGLAESYQIRYIARELRVLKQRYPNPLIISS